MLRYLVATLSFVLRSRLSQIRVHAKSPKRGLHTINMNWTNVQAAGVPSVLDGCKKGAPPCGDHSWATGLRVDLDIWHDNPRITAFQSMERAQMFSRFTYTLMP